MTFVRFLMLLSLAVWVGGIVFFAFVVAPTVFSVLPTRRLAGLVVTRSLGLLHWIGVAAGAVFLAASLIGGARLLAPRHLLVAAMIMLTVVSQAGLSRRMQTLREQMGEIDSVAASDPRRIEFNRLHAWSTRIEGGVLLLGLAAVYLVAKDPSLCGS
ncbi:MAG TPA: DUF4149 domain-containing protein [Terriglobales bacterium]|nr:DUF4149 domain-containing protein [Terriglobales bacterium]